MTIRLDHTIIPARDKAASAAFFAGIFALPVATSGPFAAVAVNETLTLDFADREQIEPHHLAFRVSKAEFAAIFARIEAAGVPYSADPQHSAVGQVYQRDGDRGFYFHDPSGHNLEVLTCLSV
ncbi:MAG: VOC family protein [Candidatus Sericytochromatia bacterium]|nr:VOC family protein [Candidatus Sericytochromatia bacterium]